MSFPVHTNPRAFGHHNSRARRLPRITIAVTLLLALVLPALTIIHATAQDGASNDVLMFRGNPARTGEFPGPGPDPDEPIVTHWSFETEGVIKSSPAVADGVVYISSTDGHLYAIDAESGETIWTAEIGYSESPPTVAKGVVYVGSSDNAVYAIDAKSGQQLWVAQFDTAITEEVVASPAVVDGTVYIGSTDGDFYALDATTGQELWSASLGWMKASAAVVNGVVYIPQQSLRLYALDAATGEERWVFEAGNLYASYLSSPAVVDGTAYAYSNYDMNLYAIDITSGQSRWEFQIPITDSAFNSMNASPAVANGMVYLGGSDALYAIDTATGQERWSVPVDGMLDSSPVVVDGIVYAGSSNAFYAIDAETGEEAWAFPSDSEILATPAVVDGVIYLAFGNRLVAFGNPTPEMRTATAEAQATETALANEYATQVAIANITATAQAHIDATATSIAGATATSEAQAMATEEAIQAEWNTYFWTDIRDALASEVARYPGVSIASFDALGPGSGGEFIPGGFSRSAMYPIVIAGGSASATVTLAIFPSKEDAGDAMESMSGGLARSGWETEKGKGLDHDHACFTVQHSDWSEAVCYMTRDDALIVSYSTVGLPNPDAAIANAIDMANAMNNAYDQTVRPG